MNNLRWLHYLRLIAATLLFLACAAFAVLWMRGYVWFDSLYYVPPSGLKVIRIESYMGRPHFFMSQHRPGIFESGLVTSAQRLADDPFDYNYLGGSVLGFQVGGAGPKAHVAVPYWFLTTITGAISAILLTKGRLRVSLRAIIIATTLIAAILGIGVIATEKSAAYTHLYF